MGNSFIGTINSEGGPEDDPNMLVEVSIQHLTLCKTTLVVYCTVLNIARVSSHIYDLMN